MPLEVPLLTIGISILSCFSCSSKFTVSKCCRWNTDISSGRATQKTAYGYRRGFFLFLADNDHQFKHAEWGRSWPNWQMLMILWITCSRKKHNRIIQKNLKTVHEPCTAYQERPGFIRSSFPRAKVTYTRILKVSLSSDLTSSPR